MNGGRTGKRTYKEQTPKDESSGVIWQLSWQLSADRLQAD